LVIAEVSAATPRTDPAVAPATVDRGSAFGRSSSPIAPSLTTSPFASSGQYSKRAYW
jgi:hypothetical protein